MMRLLPWPGVDGKPCYLDSDAAGTSFLSRLADNLESVQLGMSRELLDHVRTDVLQRHVDEIELSVVVSNLCSALTDVLRVAECRGQRLPAPDDDLDPEEAARMTEVVGAFTSRALTRREAR
ncbi:hypothetical protein [Streptomyces sp. NPDC087270]|uniref:hypothetical protein n=1 Tax=Streptomyces sp. NPDC087270 TaxID=3365774 RepID=UPI0037F782E8